MELAKRVKITIGLLCIRDPLPVGKGGKIIKSRGLVVVVDGIRQAAVAVSVEARH